MFNKIISQCKSEDEKKQMKELMQVCKPLTEAILKVIESDLAELDKVDWEDFKNPSWAFERAAKDGYKKGLTKLKDYVII